MNERKFYILLVGIMLGFFIMAQSKSLSAVNDILERDNKSNVFQEIQILKEKNKSLKGEMSDLEANLELLSNQGEALKAINDEIEKYEKLSGQSPIFGPGVVVKLDGDISTQWLTDFINELWNTGAQAVDVNGIRLTNDTLGFDTLPQGQILLNGSILSSPYTIGFIGEYSVIMPNLEVSGGIFDRLRSSFPDLVITLDRKDILRMN